MPEGQIDLRLVKRGVQIPTPGLANRAAWSRTMRVLQFRYLQRAQSNGCPQNIWSEWRDVREESGVVE